MPLCMGIGMMVVSLGGVGASGSSFGSAEENSRGLGSWMFPGIEDWVRRRSSIDSRALLMGHRILPLSNIALPVHCPQQFCLLVILSTDVVLISSLQPPASSVLPSS